MSAHLTARQTHFSPAFLAAHLAAAEPAKPLFVYNALMLPKAFAFLHSTLSPQRIAGNMTPATLSGYERMAVKGTDFPAQVLALLMPLLFAGAFGPLVGRAEVREFLVVGLCGEQRGAAGVG
ncbi:hypothetical protein MMC30_001124 [Trapelia coarctata]|nr:hypothetical protein [Trapelia coarctata]